MSRFVKFNVVEDGDGRPSAAVAASKTLDPRVNIIDSMSEDMKRTLDGTDVPDEEKLKAYNQQLARKQTYVRRYTEDLRRRRRPPVREAIEEADVVKKDLMTLLPPSLRDRGELLLEHLKMRGIRYGPRGELIINDGEPIEGTNIAVLVDDILRKRKTTAPPEGWREMRGVLGRSNIPHQFIGNWQRYGREEESTDDDDEFEESIDDRRPDWVLEKYKKEGLEPQDF